MTSYLNLFVYTEYNLYRPTIINTNTKYFQIVYSALNSMQTPILLTAYLPSIRDQRRREPRRAPGLPTQTRAPAKKF